MMRNSIMAALSQMPRGGNPKALLNQLAQQDPQVAQAMRMLEGKNAQQLRTMAQNMAKERGTTVEAVAQELGFALPK